MKSGAKPQLEAKWWRKNKAKTLPQTGLGKALDLYEARLDKFDYTKAISALKDVQKSVDIGLKKGSKTLHKDTLAVLKLYAPLIKKETVSLKKKLAQEKQKGPAVPKQKVGSKVIVWSRDIGEQFMKTHGRNHKWLTTLKGGTLELLINDDILDVIEKEGDQVLAMRMVDKANKYFPKVLDDLDSMLTELEKKEKDPKKLNKAVHKAIASLNKKHAKKIEAIPGKVWAKYVAKKEQYKDYKIETGFNIAISGLKCVISGLTIASAAVTGGATLALGIYGGVQSVGEAATVARNACQEAETVVKRLVANLTQMKEEWEDTEKKAGNIAKATGKTIADTILNFPVLPTVKSCGDDLKLADNKVAGLDIKNVALSKKVTKALKDVDKLDAELSSADKKKAAKAMKQIHKLRENLSKVLDDTSTMGKRVTDNEKALKEIGKLMEAVEEGVPNYVKAFEKIFPVVHNLAFAAANAGIGFADAKNALDTANTSIGLANDLLGEVKSQLS